MKKIVCILLFNLLLIGISAEGTIQGSSSNRVGFGLTNCTHGRIIPDTAAVFFEFPLSDQFSAEALIYIADIVSLIEELNFLPGVGCGINWYPFSSSESFLLEGLTIGLRASMYSQIGFLLDDVLFNFAASAIAQAGLRIPLGSAALDIKAGLGFLSPIGFNKIGEIVGGTTISILFN
jgi:hypothetical protein